MTQSQFVCVVAWGILLIYLVLGSLFAWRTPDWQAPDEPAHYNYIAQIAAGQVIPVIEMGDWDFEYLEALKASGFDPDLLADLDTVQYEDHQPPLYYWLSTPIFVLTDGNLLVLRMVSVLMGAITVSFAYQIGRKLFPDTPTIALAAMALVAFIPQNLHILSSINNDALTGVWIAVLLWLLVRDESPKGWQLGFMLGLIVITKTTAYFMAGVVFSGLLLHWWNRDENRIPADFIRSLIPVAWAALPFAIFWWGRNIFVYGFPDFLGLGAHDAVVIGQPRTADGIAALGLDVYLQNGLTTTFNSFWGQFGWMAAPLTNPVPWAYPLLLILVLAALAGLIFQAFRKNESATLTGSITIIFAAVIVLTGLQFVYYNSTFQQFQGRYLFTALIPASILLALGLDTWRNLFFGRWAWSTWLTVGAFAWLALLNLYLIWRVIPGALS